MMTDRRRRIGRRPASSTRRGLLMAGLPLVTFHFSLFTLSLYSGRQRTLNSATSQMAVAATTFPPTGLAKTGF